MRKDPAAGALLASRKLRGLAARAIAKLEVRDTGVGIDTSYQSHLFERFSQEESGYSRRYDGSGLGLALVKHYLERNGARLGVESEKAQGFGVHDLLPGRERGRAEPATHRQGKPPMSKQTQSASRPGVLVVEDDPETQGFMRVLLGRRYDVVLAGSGDEMRRRLESDGERIHVVLMDLSLKGGEDGLQLTRALRADPRWVKLPVIAVTAHAFPADRANALAAGCDAYVEKPIDNDRLLRMIERYLGAG